MKGNTRNGPDDFRNVLLKPSIRPEDPPEKICPPIIALIFVAWPITSNDQCPVKEYPAVDDHRRNDEPLPCYNRIDQGASYRERCEYCAPEMFLLVQLHIIRMSAILQSYNWNFKPRFHSEPKRYRQQRYQFALKYAVRRPLSSLMLVTSCFLIFSESSSLMRYSFLKSSNGCFIFPSANELE